MSTVYIRRYEPGYEEAYVHIWNETYKTCSWFKKHGPIKIEDAEKIVEERTKKSPTYNLVFAEMNGKIVGFIESMIRDVEIGYIEPYEPCVLPKFQQRNIENMLLEAAISHLRENGAKVIRFSIIGLKRDIMPYINLYKDRDFQIWRQAQSMQRSLETPIPKLQLNLPLEILTAKELTVDSFVDFFIKCFRDSQDRDASQIASDVDRTRRFIQSLRDREGERHDPECWIATFLFHDFAGFAIAQVQGKGGLIAEVGVVPKFRRKKIGTFLTLEVMQRLKKHSLKQIYLGVDKQNIAAISLYQNLGFKRIENYEIIELEKQL